MLLSVSLMLLGALGGFNAVQDWDFADAGITDVWHANSFLADVKVEDGALHARTIDWDPFFTCESLEIPATASQCVLIRIKANKPGKGQLFWTGQTDGKYEGFSEQKLTNFTVSDSEAFQDIYLFPFWQSEKVIRKLRLDLYDETEFSIQRVAILDHDNAQPVTSPQVWEFDADEENTKWISLNNGMLLSGPSLSVNTMDVGWISLALEAKKDATVSVEWSTDAMLGSHEETVYVEQHEEIRHYYMELQGDRNWSGKLVGMLLHVPDPDSITIKRIALTTEPDGPPEIEVAYFGFENGVNRAGRQESLLAQIVNRGGGEASVNNVVLDLPDGLTLLGDPEYSDTTALQNGDSLDIHWSVEAEKAATYRVTLKPDGATPTTEAVLTFMPSVEMKADYVPEPYPVNTSVDICAYYFPGWNADVKYDCIRNTAPIRKPLLGYYDESNPECVDWQIKWAVENGISCFLVDWYWVAGNQHLFHWFDAYRKARYRDYLKVAIMWANHNPSGTHSREDWRNVTQEWIDKYFSLPGYYHINGKPAVFLWNDNIIRDDLGGSDAVAEAFAESQQMAEKAGHKGIEFIILRHHANAQDLEKCKTEGYAGHTSYHEFGRASGMAPHKSQGRYSDVVATGPEDWEERHSLSDALTYYPVVDTGWDSRPWHGPNAMAFHGRNATNFKDFLNAAKTYCNKYDQQILILGPVNEWGEGSYIEPNLEFGFTMYEAIREVFGEGVPAAWPQNLSPRDVGRGPYDFPRTPQKTAWNFDADMEGWAAMMNVSTPVVAEGIMHFKTTSSDPALVLSTPGLRASRFGKLLVRMKVDGDGTKESSGQLFWSIGNSSASEATSMHFTVETDGVFHDYTLNLKEHPRWRGRIGSLRFDPCNTTEAEVFIDYIGFE